MYVSVVGLLSLRARSANALKWIEIVRVTNTPRHDSENCQLSLKGIGIIQYAATMDIDMVEMGKDCTTIMQA